MAYLDYAGASLPSRPQLDAIHSRMVSLPLSNPHSRHPISIATGHIVDNARARILRHCGVFSDEYSLVFTTNTTASIHAVATSFTFGEKKREGCRMETDFNGEGPAYGYILDSHTSVVGAREIAKDRVDRVICFDPRDDVPLVESFRDIPKVEDSLFVLTGMSNFDGRIYPLEVVQALQDKGWSVCYDAASLVSSCPLLLSSIRPHFVVFSFYKMFGYPTGIAALLIRNDIANKLKVTPFGGGTVKMYLPSEFYHEPKDLIRQHFEPGTSNFYAIVATKEGFEEIERCGGIDGIHQHTQHILEYAHECLSRKTHPNGQPIIRIYEHAPPTVEERGPIINFNILRDDGSVVGFTEVERMAELFGICLRTGCFCNVGACQKYLHLGNELVRKNFESGKRCGDTMDVIDGEPAGSVRVSFGRLTTQQDIDLLSSMVDCCFAGTIPMVVPVSSLSPISSYTTLLSSIRLYPVKSCRGMQVESWPLSDSGLLFDRRFSIVSNDLVLTQKKCRALCSVATDIDLDRSLLLLSMDDSDKSISVPLDTVDGVKTGDVVCTNRVDSLDMGNNISSWLSDVLSLPARLRSALPDGDSNFANSSPYLLVNASSVDVLSKIVGMPSDDILSRFRPNLVVTGIPPFLEDRSTEIVIDGVAFEVQGKCSRCEMICIDQKSGEKNPALILSLRNYRKGERMTFGVYIREKEFPSTKKRISVGSKVHFTFDDQ